MAEIAELEYNMFIDSNNMFVLKFGGFHSKLKILVDTVVKRAVQVHCAVYLFQFVESLGLCIASSISADC